MSAPSKPELKYHDQFVELLADYRPNQSTLALLRRTALVLLVAPTGSGRNTLIDRLCRDYNYHFLLSDTTRQPRKNDGVLEVSGQRYWFLVEQQFLANLKQGHLIEAAIIHNQQVSGIHADRLRQAADQDKPAITDMDIQGYLTLKSYQPAAQGIFVLPPNFAEWLKRLDNRGSLSSAEKRRRLTSAKTELESSLKLPGLNYVVNDDLAAACRQINQLVRQAAPLDQADARRLARELLLELRDYLSA